MAELVAAAVRREMDGGLTLPTAYVHRMPLGLMLLEQGCLSREQLRQALEQQRRAAGEGAPRIRVGEWLITSGTLSEPALTRALGMQWSCPVLRLEGCRPEDVVSALPGLLAELTGALPVRVAGGRRLYLAFAGDLDRSLSYAVERITGLQVTAGVSADSEFRSAHGNYLASPGPRTRFLEAVSGAALGRAITKLVERERPVEARLARVHNCYWLRLWKQEPGKAGLPQPGEVEDVLCTMAVQRSGAYGVL